MAFSSNSNTDCKAEELSELIKMIENSEPEKSALERKITLQHVKQCHFPPLDLICSPEDLKPVFQQVMDDADQIEEIAYSQFYVAKTILAHPNAIVLHEGQDEDLTPEVAKKLKSDPKSALTRIQEIFPYGIPDRFYQLTKTQKQFLAFDGGANVLFYLGKITHVYKTTSEEESKTTANAVTKRDYNLLLEPREKQALFLAKQAALQSGKNHILLVYGAAHNFERYKDAMSKEGIEILESIDTTKPPLPLPDRFASSFGTRKLTFSTPDNFYSSSGNTTSPFRMFGVGVKKFMSNLGNRKNVSGVMPRCI